MRDELCRCARLPLVYTTRATRTRRMKTSRAVLAASAAVCAVVIAQGHPDPTEPAVATPAPATTAADTSAWALPKLPPFKLEGVRDWFPEVARRDGLEGRVLVGFDIAAQGSAKNISVIWSSTRVFESNAVGMLRTARFSVPSDWMESGGWRRWRLGFVFRLSPSCESDEFAIPVEKVLVTGSRVIGAPVHNYSGSSATVCNEEMARKRTSGSK